MRPKKYPYTGSKINKVTTTGIGAQELVVVKQHDNATIIYFRIPKVFGYEEERAKVYLSYEKTMRILNSY